MSKAKKLIAICTAAVLLCTTLATTAFAAGNISDVAFTFALLSNSSDVVKERPKYDDSWVYIKCTSAEYKFQATPCVSFAEEVGTKWAFDECGNTYTIYNGSTRWMINYIYENYGYGQNATIMGVGVDKPTFYVVKGVWSPDSV